MAEEICFGEDRVTTGASGDLQQVRSIARRMVAQWGFAFDRIGGGPVAWEAPAGNGLLEPTRAASPSTEKELDVQVGLFVRAAYDTCYKTLAANRELLDRLAEKLVEEETVDYIELERMRDAHFAAA